MTQTARAGESRGGNEMPRFVDVHHKMPEITPDMAEMMKARIVGREADEFDCVAIDIMAGDEGPTFCVTDGPSKEAVVKSHTSKGVDLDISDVHQVMSMASN